MIEEAEVDQEAEGAEEGAELPGVQGDLEVEGVVANQVEEADRKL